MKKLKVIAGRFTNVHIPRMDGAKANHKAILTGVIAKLYKGANGKKVADLLEDEESTTEDITDALLEADKTRVTEMNKGKTFQDGYKKAKADERAAFEAEIKTKYGIEEGDEGYELTGQELIDQIVTTKAGEAAGKSAGKDASKLTTEEIKALPGYHAIEKEWKKTVKDTETQWKEKLDGLESKQTQEQLFSEFKKAAFDKLDALKPVLPKNATVAQNLKNKFVDDFRQYEIRKNDDGSFSFLKDGKIVEDGHGSTLDFEDAIKTTAGNFFEFQENNGGGNSGNNNEGATGAAGSGAGKKVGYPEGYVRPKNLEEYHKVVADRNIDLEVRKQFQTAYSAENSATGD